MSSPFGWHGSYLQGMETLNIHAVHSQALTCTDPTYKEWKPYRLPKGKKAEFGTDPTYKEWKRMKSNLVFIRVNKHGSYLQGMETCDLKSQQNPWCHSTDPTYKEWKPVFMLGKAMRGNSTDPTYKEWKPRVRKWGQAQLANARILPTRNGNVCVNTLVFYRKSARILPTRNGNFHIQKPLIN